MTLGNMAVIEEAYDNLAEAIGQSFAPVEYETIQNACSQLVDRTGIVFSYRQLARIAKQRKVQFGRKETLILGDRRIQRFCTERIRRTETLVRRIQEVASGR